MKKDQPLFQFDRRPYEYKVQQIEAQLAEAKQNVEILRTNVEFSSDRVVRTQANLDYALNMQGRYDRLAQVQAVKEDDTLQWGPA